MATVIETSMWVDFFRPKTPLVVKERIKPWMLRHDIALCEPVVCELLRSAAAAERALIGKHFASIPLLHTPSTLWREATELGQQCYDAGILIGALDLLIAAVCIHHGATLVTFDEHFGAIAKLSQLNAHVLTRS